MRLIISIALICLVSPKTLANCAQIYDSLEFVCKVSGNQMTSIKVPAQEVCGASYKGIIHKSKVTILEGPMMDDQGGYFFEIAGPGKSSHSLGPCVEKRAEIIH